jgi:hypothetical protein
LYPKLADLLDYCLHNDIGKVVIATNGTIPMRKDVVNLFRNGNVEVRISDYNLPKQKAVQMLTKQCKSSNIRLWLYRFASGTGDWVELGGPNHPREDSDDKVESKFSQCPFRGCLTLENGIMARCSRAPLAHIIQKYEPAETDFFKCRDFNTGKEYKDRLAE